MLGGVIVAKALVILLVVLTAVGVFAQSDAPVGLMEAGDFRALTVTDDARYLLVADAETDQVRVYDLSDLTAPVLVTSVGVEGRPIDLASGRGFTLAAVESSFSPSTIEVIAPARYEPNGTFAAGENFVDLPFAVERLITSANGRYALAIGADAFALLNLRAADEIDSRVFDTQVGAAAFADDRLIYAEGSGIASLQIEGLNDLTPTVIIDAGATVRALATDPAGNFLAAALTNGQLLLLDPTTLTTLATVSLPGVHLLQFALANGSPQLGAAVERGSAVTLFDVSGRTLQALASAPALSGAIEALTAFEDHLVATDGTTIAIFSLQS